MITRILGLSSIEFQHSFSLEWPFGHIYKQKMEIILVLSNGRILEHQCRWVIMMIGLNGMIKHIEEKRLTKKKKATMVKEVWADKILGINAENVEQWKYLVYITAVAVKDVFTKWITTAHGLIIVWAYLLWNHLCSFCFTQYVLCFTNLWICGSSDGKEV